ncbi:MAG: Omp28-related outer membrane protein [Bacteroidetes bacterium]|nr:Omp28-related outer membrane protein [Bacteroidota bacterium]
MKPIHTSYLLLLTSYFLLAFLSCDKVKEPYVKTNSSSAGCPPPVFTAKAPMRKVLIEEYTGMRCGNCPGAALILENLRNTYGNKLIGIAAHANYYARPVPPESMPCSAPAGAFSHYLGCTAGENYFTVFNFPGNPYGLVNRHSVSGSPIIDPSNWDAAFQSIDSLPPDADINIITDYNTATRKLCISCKTTFLKAMNGAYNLSVLFVEDSILDWQEDYSLTPCYVQNYVFRNVLRDDINGNGLGFGEQIALGAIAVNDTAVKSYSYNVPAGFSTSIFSPNPASTPLSPCDYKHCYVLAFVFDANSASPTYREILQAEIKKIQ